MFMYPKVKERMKNENFKKYCKVYIFSESNDCTFAFITDYVYCIHVFFSYLAVYISEHNFYHTRTCFDDIYSQPADKSCVQDGMDNTTACNAVVCDGGIFYSG